LKKRGLKVGGNKSQLVKRLQTAYDKEQENEEEEEEENDGGVVGEKEEEIDSVPLPKETERTFPQQYISIGYTDKNGNEKIQPVYSRIAHEYDIPNALPNARQIYVEDLCKLMNKIKYPDAYCTVGITMEDMFVGHDDSFIMGLAYPGRVAVFSFGRYTPHKSWIRDPNDGSSSTSKSSKGKDNKNNLTQTDIGVLLNRGCKVLVHEIGHLFGIGHCVYYSFLMNGSGHLEEDYAQPMWECPVDLHKLQDVLGFNVETRYESLLEFCEKHNTVFYPKEIAWLRNRISNLKNLQDIV